ncbi:orotidine 5'-phosphate decarboxylase [Pseudoroseicyclus aestuarii]|uniref:Orotidine 5'-phosphate decarboxylase n=1 Tax=Pseudoroseicyclus aestuarii TaxID=1795041 RepID=A0A318SWM3_9RHOB|nr:orotidine 5'-phosphate decarboxylase [Pseudoroseicyclus aestuarii]PYE84217.1 hypothetical protein DFP88_1029 [Pseudoroseicyclus aestuarii]
MNNIQMGDIRYNAQVGAFEARVDVIRGGSTFRYPCQVAGPIDMDDAQVRASLASHALRQSDSGSALWSHLG